MKALQHAEHQAQVALDELVPGLHVPRVNPGEQFPHLLPLEHRQLAGIYAADFHFALCHVATSNLDRQEYCHREKALCGGGTAAGWGKMAGPG